MAVLNTGQLAANVRILAIRPDGELLGFFGTVLQPGNRLSALIDELIPAAAGQGGGFIWVKSDLPVQMTSLFGSASVLSNVPPQPSPSSFQPDSGITPLVVNPPFAIVQPQSKKEFQVLGTTDPVSWSVNGIPGGNVTIGTIDSQGVFTAPGEVPDPRVLTISAQSPSQVGGASVDVLEKSVLFTSLSVVQSVAYLGSLERLYTAELAILSGGFSTGEELLPAAAPSQEATNSDIFEFAPDGSKLLLNSFENEEIVNMKPFRAFNGTEFLLLVARTSGKIIRCNPPEQECKDVIFGLNQPTTAVIDATGNLLVAEADKVSIFPRTLLEVDLSAAFVTKSGGGTPLRQEVFGTSNISGMAVDACSGDIYVSDPDNGQILRLVRLTGELQIVVTGVDDPGALLAIYRSGVTCPDSSQILALERGNDQILLIIPATGQVTPWFAANQATDLTFIPDGTPFVATAAVLLAELLAADTQQNGFLGGVTTIGVSGSVEDRPINPPQQDDCQGGVPLLPDPVLEAKVKESLGLADTDVIPCSEVENLTVLNAANQGITSLGGLEVFTNLTAISLESNSISNIGPLCSLTGVNSLNLADNNINDIACLALTTVLRDLNLENNAVVDIGPLAGLALMTDLDLSGNAIQDISPLSGLTEMTDLDLSNNQISNIGALSGLCKLTNLFLQDNQVADISPLCAPATTPAPVAMLVSSSSSSPLTVLNLSGNQIFDLSSLASLTGLIELLLADNHISDVGPLEFLTALSFLDLSGNVITDFTALISNTGLGSGDRIDLNGNPFGKERCIDLTTLSGKGVFVINGTNCSGSIQTAEGPDLFINSSSGTAGGSATLDISFKPGPPDGASGGSDENSAIILSLDFTESQLDCTDSNSDGIPDSVSFSLPTAFIKVVLCDASDTDGEIDIAIVGVPPLILREQRLLQITFDIKPGATAGRAFVTFSTDPFPDLGDTQAQTRILDEAAGGEILIF